MSRTIALFLMTSATGLTACESACVSVGDDGDEVSCHMHDVATCSEWNDDKVNGDSWSFRFGTCPSQGFEYECFQDIFLDYCAEYCDLC